LFGADICFWRQEEAGIMLATQELATAADLTAPEPVS
jgi:hypothetical protein